MMDKAIPIDWGYQLKAERMKLVLHNKIVINEFTSVPFYEIK